ncbi:MAG: 1-acyl-sn-glycerol-3-phosphate acyltransferase, partial [Bacteroidaceae bacterium]|nr:1-acyl-sn-glycerol-3-phosphate acyltransferase [Bacteroidaceae bacterium]
MNLLYRLFQLFVAFPIMLVISVLTALVTTIGSTIGSAHFWGYYPPMVWSKLMCWFFLLPVKVEGKSKLDPSSSYVFVANHQGAYDIFLIYGFIGRNFKWMMKKSIRRMPLFGKACES